MVTNPRLGLDLDTSGNFYNQGLSKTGVAEGTYTNPSVTVGLDGRITSIQSVAMTGRLIAKTIVTASTAYLKSINNPSFIIVEGYGGGGGGGGVAATGQTWGGGGGGAGGCFIKKIDAASLDASVAITIGAGGATGSGTTTSGGQGGTTSFGTICSANGGIGGNYASHANGPLGGIGGLSTGGDLNIRGMAGSPGVYGGGAKGIGGNGGCTYLGGNGRGTRDSITSAALANTGSGGAGLGSQVIGGNAAGGSGLLIIYEYA
jgi:hypothetical protein